MALKSEPCIVKGRPDLHDGVARRMTRVGMASAITRGGGGRVGTAILDRGRGWLIGAAAGLGAREKWSKSVMEQSSGWHEAPRDAGPSDAVAAGPFAAREEWRHSPLRRGTLR
jgi:hypothetical protein